ncbi:lytic transglycosylase domain-containing protein [Alcaligenaceae bacterium]|nr:lytic transglycosylase domain-containing protein [Alcaligenaceae bacterium]
MIAELAALMLTCAPNIHPVTLKAVIRHESRLNPYAIGVNNKEHRLKSQPDTLGGAKEIVQDLIKLGIDFDAGLGQINVRNWKWLGLTPKTVFDPCTNLQAAQAVLTDCYARATRQFKAQQTALRAALSCYNTGNFQRGFGNGYVSEVLAQAGIKVPAIEATPTDSQPSDAKQTTKQAVTKQPGGDPDGFTAHPTPDGFTPPQPPAPETTPAST